MKTRDGECLVLTDNAIIEAASLFGIIVAGALVFALLAWGVMWLYGKWMW